MRWDPQVYRQFSDERNRPFFDLLARVRAENPALVVDLGCGPGDLTATLADRWPNARIVGLDNSPEMIDRARNRVTDRLTFELADVAAWQMTPDVDVVVSNAVFQWVPGHLALIREWARVAAPGTWIGWQVPGNFNAPSHALMRELAGSERWSGQLAGLLRHADVVGEPADYWGLLTAEGFLAEAWETTYLHVLQGDDPVLNWVRGTALRPVLAVLDPGDAAQFEQEYAALLREAYPAGERGTLFPFRRLFCVGQKQP
jgi:trans-aconitate 2-methyltransferase